MAVINDSNDKMRDIIAQHAEQLTTEGAEAETPEGEVETPAVETPVEEEVETPVVEGETPETVVEPGKETVVEGAEKGAKTPEGDKLAKGAVKPKKDEEHPFAKEHGIKSKDARGGENKIPFSRVLKINENAVKKAKGEWEATILKPVTQKANLYEERLNAIAETERIQFEEPRRFITMLTAIPGYRQLFDEISGGKFTAGGERVAKPADGTNLAPDANDPMPTADAKDEHGKVVGWTHEGMEKRFAWERRQAAKVAVETAKADLAKEFKPLRDRFDSVTASEKQATDIDGIISLAAKWPGFSENVTAILDEMGKGTELLKTPQQMYAAVQDAYNAVMFGTLGKVKETEEERRARYFEEFEQGLRRAPRSTGARSTVRREEPVVADENLSSDDRMRNIIVESSRKAGLIK